MKLVDEIMKLDLSPYPDMKKKDVLDFDETFNKILYSDHEKYPRDEAIEYGVGIVLKRIKVLIRECVALNQEEAPWGG